MKKNLQCNRMISQLKDTGSQVNGLYTHALKSGFRFFIGTLVMVLMSAQLLWAQSYGGGSGTEVDPYQIATKTHLKYLSEHSGDWGKHFKQTADITFETSDFESTGTFYNGGNGFDPIGSSSSAFSGSYNGQGYTISGLEIYRSSEYYVGFFGKASGKLSGIKLSALYVEGDWYVGGLVGSKSSSAPVDCETSGRVVGGIYVGGLIGYADNWPSTGNDHTMSGSSSNCGVTGFNYCGGLIGKAESGYITIQDCFFSGEIGGNEEVAGIIGGIDDLGVSGNSTSKILRCYNTGKVTGSGIYVAGIIGQGGIDIEQSYNKGAIKGAYHVGGLIGWLRGSSSFSPEIRYCYNSGAVESTHNSGNVYTGGVVGNINSSALRNSYNTGSVKAVNGTGRIGGLVGYQSGFSSTVKSYIENCYSAGLVESTNGQGLIGDYSSTSEVEVNYSYWDSEASGKTAGIGIDLTTSQARNYISFDTWDFVSETANGVNNYWDMDQDWVVNNGYPILSWQPEADNKLYKQPANGSGTSGDPYEIATLDDLILLSRINNLWDKYFIQTADIDASVTQYWDDSDDNGDGDPWNDPNDLTNAGNNEGFSGIGDNSIKFTGSYNGQGHSITGLFINRPSSSYNGLFGYSEGRLQGIRLVNVDITGFNFTAALVGRLVSVAPVNCQSSGKIKGNIGVAGLVGWTDSWTSTELDHTMSGCSSTCEITGNEQCAGLLGYYASGYIVLEDCFFSGQVNANSDAGGLIGWINAQNSAIYSGSKILRCYNTGTITTVNEQVGGLVGSGAIPIEQCYNSGRVTGKTYVGGLVGAYETSSISNPDIRYSYNSGAVESTQSSGDVYVGGAAGILKQSSINNSYNIGSVKAVDGANYVGGLVGYQQGYSTSVKSEITNCYSSGLVESSLGEGLVGGIYLANSVSTNNSYWDTQASGKNSSVGGNGLTTLQMRIHTNFTGWDFVSESANGNLDYWDLIQDWAFVDVHPVLWWQSEADNILFPKPQGGSGTSGDPFQIATLEDLKLLAREPNLWAANYYFIQTADIDASATKYWDDADDNNDGNPWNDPNDFTEAGNNEGFFPIGDTLISFAATYYGNNKTISGLEINRPSTDNVGLFGGASGALNNVILADVKIRGNNNTGALVGYKKLVAPRYCQSSGTVNGDSLVGGLVGLAENLAADDMSNTMFGCSSSCTVGGTGSYVGGLIGSATNGHFQLSTSFFTGQVSAQTFVGGLAGHIYINDTNNEIFNCYNTGSVIGVGKSVGGIAGECWINVERCYNKGYVRGTYYIGGLIGYLKAFDNNLTAIRYSYNTGTVETTYSSSDAYVGGGVGILFGTSMYDCYNIGTIKASSPFAATIGGMVGHLTGTDGIRTYLQNCYSAGILDAQGAAGVVYSHNTNNSEVINCYWDSDVSPVSSFYGTGQWTYGMQNYYNYTSWDFHPNTYNGSNDYWDMDQAWLVTNGYPILWWQPEADLIKTQQNIVVVADSISNIEADQATAYGKIPKISGSATSYGFCWNTAGNPVVSDASVDKGSTSSITTFDHQLTGLLPGTEYYVRGYANDGSTTFYGRELTFTTKAEQSITFNALANVAYGDAVFELTASSSSGLPVTFSTTDTDIITISGTTVTVIGIGTATIYADQSGNDDYLPAPQTSQQLVVDKKELTVVNAQASDKDYDGTTMATISGGSLSGIVGGDNVSLTNATGGNFIKASVDTGIEVTTNMALSGADMGNYTLAQPDYLTATINAVDLTITAEDKTKEYDGQVFSPFTVTYSGFVVGENESDLGGTLSFTGTAVAATDVSAGYEIMPTGISSNNYNIIFTPGTLSITAKELRVTAEDKTKEYDGLVFNSFTVTYNGFVTGEDETDLGGTLTFTGAATTATNVNTGYEIMPDGFSSNNYSLVYAPGSLAITKKTLTVTADDKTKEYDGLVFSPFTVTYNGFAVGEDETDLGGSLTFTGAATTATDVGSGYDIIPDGFSSNNYNLVYAPGSLAITKKTLTITAQDKTKEYDGLVFSPFTVVYAGFAVGEDETDLGGSLTFTGTATTATDVGSGYDIIPDGLSSANYNLVYAPGSLDITKRTLTITAEDKTKEYDGLVFSPFTVTYTGFVAGEDETDLGGSLTFTGAATTATDVNTGYEIMPDGLSSANYNLVYAPGSLAITKKTLTVTAEDKTKEYDGLVFSPFTVTYTGFAVGEDETDLGGSLTFTGAATAATDVSTGYEIMPDGFSSSNYNLVYAPGSLAITKKTLTIKAEDKTKEYDGLVFSPFTVTYAGFAVGEDESDLGGTLIFTGAATTAKDVSTGYEIMPDGLSSANYNLVYAPGSLAITKKTLTVTAEDKTKEYDGLVFSPFTVTYSGFVVGDDESDLGGTLTFTGAATTATDVNTGYEIMPDGLSSVNYNLVYAPGSLAITKKTLTIKADDKTKEYDGLVFSPFTVTYTGFVAGEDETDLVGSLTFTGAATTATDVSIGYEIMPDGFSSNNYNIIYSRGTLLITTKELRVTAEDKTKEYDGLVFTPFTVTYNGFVSGEDESDLGGTLNFTGTAVTATDVGSNYVITPGNLSSQNYTIVYVPGTLSITAKELQVKADNQNKVYDGQVFSLFTVSYNGFVSGDDESDLGGTLTFSGTATTATDVGDAYPIIPGNLSSANYSILYQNGELDITKKLLTVTGATAQNKPYDGTDAAVITGSMLDGVITGDQVLLLDGDKGAFDQVTVGSNIPVSTQMDLGGLDAGNYDLSQPTGLVADITRKQLTVGGSFTAQNKEYDGTVDASFDTNNLQLVGVESGDNVLLSNVVITFERSGAGNNLQVSISSADLSGAAKDQYSLDLTGSPVATASILRKAAYLTGKDNIDKTYDGGVMLPTGEIGYGQLTGILLGDVSYVTVSGQPVYGSAASGAQSVIQGSVSLSGPRADDYVLNWTDGNGTIQPAVLSVQVNESSKFVTEAEPSIYNGVSIKNFVNGEDVSVVDQSGLTITRTNSGVESAGVYSGVLEASGLVSTNYTFNYQNGDFEIIAANELYIEVRDLSVAYSAEAVYVIDRARYLDSSSSTIINLTGNVNSLGSNRFGISDGAGGQVDFTVVEVSPQLSSSSHLVIGSYQLESSSVSGSSGNFSNTIHVTGTLTVSSKEVLVQLGTGSTEKAFDGDADMDNLNLIPTGLVNGDQVSVSGSGSFSQSSSGDNLPYSISFVLDGVDKGNYHLGTVSPLNGTDGRIGKIGVSVSGAVAVSRVYDGTTIAAINNAVLSGVVPGEDVVLIDGDKGVFSQAEVGTGLGVTTSMSLGGQDAGNYSLSQPAGLSANITQKALNVIQAVVKEKVYDKSPEAELTGAVLEGVVSGDLVNLIGGTTGTFVQQDVGTGLSVTTNMSLGGQDAPNYSLVQPSGLSGNIIPRELRVLQAVAQDRDYNKTQDAVISGGVLDGVLNGDDVSLINSSTGVFSSVGPGTSIPVTSSMSLSGGSASNYQLVQPALLATISPASITIGGSFTVREKVYDGTTSAGLDSDNLQAVGAFAGDVVTLSSLVFSFESSNVGNGIKVLLSGGNLSGNAASHYVLSLQNAPEGLGNITKKELTVTADPQTREQGSPNPSLTFNYSGFVGREDESVIDVPPVATTNVDVNSPEGSYPGAITLSGGQDNNYQFNYVAGDFTVVNSVVAVSITLGNLEQVYDGQAKVVSVSTLPADIPVIVTYNGVVESPIDTGKYEVLVKVDQVGYDGSAKDTLIVLADTDLDGLADISDPDDDNDGVPDTEDAFPVDPTETVDSDGDGVGDNGDAFPDNADKSEDTQAPVVYCRPLTIYVNTGGNYVLNKSDIEWLSKGDDLLGVTRDDSTPYEELLINVSKDSYSGNDVGQEFTVVVTVADPYGNEGSCETTVKVEENHAPELSGSLSPVVLEWGDTISGSFPEGLFTDADSEDLLSYSLLAMDGSALPAWLYFDSEKMEYKMNPDEGDVGSHSFNLKATDKGGLTAEVEFGVVVQFRTGIDELADLEMSVYPNPAKNMIYVVIGNLSAGEVEISLQSLSGQVVYLEKRHFINEPIKIDLSAYHSGFYFIKVKQGTQLKITKLILQKE